MLIWLFTYSIYFVKEKNLLSYVHIFTRYIVIGISYQYVDEIHFVLNKYHSQFRRVRQFTFNGNKNNLYEVRNLAMDIGEKMREREYKFIP